MQPFGPRAVWPSPMHPRGTLLIHGPFPFGMTRQRLGFSSTGVCSVCLLLGRAVVGRAESGSGGIGRDGGSSGIGGDGNGGSSGKGGFLSNLMSGIPMLNTIMKNMNKPSKPSNVQEQVQRQEKAQEKAQEQTQRQEQGQTQRQSKAPKTRQNNTKIEFSRQNNYADDLLKGMTNTKRRDISEMDSIGDLSEDD